MIVTLYFILGFLYVLYVMYDAEMLSGHFLDSETYQKIIAELNSHPMIQPSWYPAITCVAFLLCWIGWPYFLYKDVKQKLTGKKE